jgi:hypothetical protein
LESVHIGGISWQAGEGEKQTLRSQMYSLHQPGATSRLSETDTLFSYLNVFLDNQGKANPNQRMKPLLEHLPTEGEESFFAKAFDLPYFATPWHYHPNSNWCWS